MDKRSEMLAKDGIGSLLLKLSLPAAVGMIVQALYNVVDAIFVVRGC
jgi:Na+-driven multidrug efflux pump